MRLPWILKRWWRTPLFALLFILVALIVVACGGGSKASPTTGSTITPKPGAIAPPRGAAPGCNAQVQKEIEEGKGRLGACAPKPSAFGAPRLAPHGQSGPDVSNNDPFYNWRPVKAHGHPFGYLKINQGTGFIDSTAASMASAMRAAGVIPGGYDFLEVCRTSSIGEARLFAARLRAIGLIHHALVPMGDAEWPLSVPCSAASARAWLLSWAAEVRALTGVQPGFYTGAWWSNPNAGCWTPPGKGKRWVSGYTARVFLAIPCGWGGVDLWQYTDAGFNGVSSTDMSVLEVPLSSFVGSALTPAQERAAKVRSLHAHEHERAVLHRLIDAHHCRPGQHNTPRQPRHTRLAYHKLCGEWLHRGQRDIEVVARYRRELKLRRAA